MPGTTTSGVEVTNTSPHGFWILLDGRELFLPFDEFPWFRDATVAEITELERPRPDRLRWRRLDVDLTVDSIEPRRHQSNPRALRSG